MSIDALDARVFAGFNAERLAAAAVPHDVAFLIPFRPLPIDASDLLARHQNGSAMLVTIDMTLALHRAVDRIVQILARLIVRRDDERRVRIFNVLVRDCHQALLARADFMNAGLMVEPFDRALHIPTRELFNDGLARVFRHQLRVLALGRHSSSRTRTGEERLLGLLQGRHGLLARHGREIFEEL